MTFQIALEPNYSAFVRVCEQFSAPSSSDPDGVFRELEKFDFEIFSSSFVLASVCKTLRQPVKRNKIVFLFFAFLRTTRGEKQQKRLKTA